MCDIWNNPNPEEASTMIAFPFSRTIERLQRMTEVFNIKLVLRFRDLLIFDILQKQVKFHVAEVSEQVVLLRLAL
jgi:hypothetical protein